MASVGFNPAEKTIHYKILFGNRGKNTSEKKDNNVNNNTYYNKFLENKKTKSTGNPERDKIIASAKKFDENGNPIYGKNQNVNKEEPSTWQKIKNFFNGENKTTEKESYSSGNYTRKISDAERQEIIKSAQKFSNNTDYGYGDL